MEIHENFREIDIEEIALGIGKVAYHFAARRKPTICLKVIYTERHKL